MKDFDKEIERILKDVYFNPIVGTENIAKRVVIETEYRYIEFLENEGLIIRLKNVSGGGKFGIQLENKGYEIFEKYGGWEKYKKKVIERKTKIEKSKELAQRFWWLPILISFAAFILALFALLKK